MILILIMIVIVIVIVILILILILIMILILILIVILILILIKIHITYSQSTQQCRTVQDNAICSIVQSSRSLIRHPTPIANTAWPLGEVERQRG
jgi:hypothetical protein